ncbi:hypothetical protein F3Y22_tig00008957pilonHSYRG00159 [Hibiscus syriacus]|uniref:Uncharacterized protein n=1 Tax=Hibiscus syriacus TaxID=106335 RepID=A0A6A3C7Y9_HIBSY|nr:hypothetical protein F3Y22_tig00008957pilonHSYRG00159 [Hibiscus syriacus]
MSIGSSQTPLLTALRMNYMVPDSILTIKTIPVQIVMLHSNPAKTESTEEPELPGLVPVLIRLRSPSEDVVDEDPQFVPRKSSKTQTFLKLKSLTGAVSGRRSRNIASGGQIGGFRHIQINTHGSAALKSLTDTWGQFSTRFSAQNSKFLPALTHRSARHEKQSAMFRIREEQSHGGGQGGGRNCAVVWWRWEASTDKIERMARLKVDVNIETAIIAKEWVLELWFVSEMGGFGIRTRG